MLISKIILRAIQIKIKVASASTLVTMPDNLDCNQPKKPTATINKNSAEVAAEVLIVRRNEIRSSRS